MFLNLDGKTNRERERERERDGQRWIERVYNEIKSKVGRS